MGPVVQAKISKRNYERLLKLKEKADADSIDEVIDWLLDFWFSWSERNKNKQGSSLDFGYDV